MKRFKKILIAPWIFCVTVYNWIAMNKIVKQLRGDKNKPAFCKFTKVYRSILDNWEQGKK